MLHEKADMASHVPTGCVFVRRKRLTLPPMIPLKTLPDASQKPFWTRVLAVSIALVWAVQLAFSTLNGCDLALEFGVRPVCYFHPWGCGVTEVSLPPLHLSPFIHWAQMPFGHLVLAPFFSLWLHANWWHVGFNLLFLLVFGGALEGEIGRFRFLRLYLTGGLVATVCHVAFNARSDVATIGASGAIAALLGAHFWRLPRAWVLTYFPPVFLFPLPAPLFGLLWIGAQFVSASQNFHLPFFGPSSGGGIAWMAHVGGFIWGASSAYRFGARQKKGRKNAIRAVR